MEELYRLRCSVVPSAGPEEAGAVCQSSNPADEVAATLGFYRRRKKPSAAEMQDISQELEDLVKSAPMPTGH